MLGLDGVLPGWTVTDSGRYSDKELYGYINGGAELYREFGFDHLVTRVMRKKEAEISMELYRMRTPEAAFGIYSLSRGACGQDSTLCVYSCVSTRQILCCRGSSVLSIIGDDTGAETAEAMRQAARVLLGKMREADHRLPALFSLPLIHAYSVDVRFLAGPLALQQAHPEWEPYFDGIRRYSLHTLTWETDNQWYIAGLIVFEGAEDRMRFLRNTGFGGRDVTIAWSQVTTGSQLRAVRTTDTGELLFCETDGGNPGFRSVIEALTP